ncbi:MAG: M48 family metallopeptidase [Opitutales bacterium]
MLKESLWILLIAFLLGEAVLLLLNHRSISKNFDNNIFSDFIDNETFKKTIAYSLVRNHFSFLSLFYKVLILGFILKLDLIPLYLNHFSPTNNLWMQSTLLFFWLFLFNLLFLPLDLLHTFKIEKDFGFNRSTPQLWCLDQIKSTLVSACINIPIFALLLYLLKAFPTSWWIWGALGSLFFQIVMVWLYPKVILPLFNKLTPLADGSLKTRLVALAQKVGFASTAIQVLDSSKRSTHSNAYCSSLGKIQHIVLFDTLLKNFSDEEIEAILAHEIGHYKCKHIFKMLLTSTLFTLIGLKICDIALQSNWIAEQLGLIQTTPLLLLILISTFSPILLYWFNPILNHWSRKYEYEADAFANTQSSSCGHYLIQSLKKLYRENLSNLFPHPWYSCFHYSHPTLLEREKAIYDKNHFSENHR